MGSTSELTWSKASFTPDAEERTQKERKNESLGDTDALAKH
jgi:hypothetical protein